MLHLSQWTSQFVQNISMTIRHPLSLDPLSLDPLSLDPLSLRFTSYKEKLPERNPQFKGTWEKPQGEQQRRDPSPRTDRRAIDAVCIYTCKPSQADSGGGGMHLKVV